MEVDNTAATAQDNTAPGGESPLTAPAKVQGENNAPLSPITTFGDDVHHDGGGTETPVPAAAEQKPDAAPTAYKTSLLVDAPEKQDGQEQKPEDGQGGEAAPEPFEIKIPEGFTADEESLGELKQLVAEGALSKESAQKAADIHLKAIERYEAYRFQKGQEQIAAWEAEMKAHPQYGGASFGKNCETAKNILHRYGSPELAKDFNDMGVLSHPRFFDFLMKVSEDVSDGASIGGAGQAMPETTAAKVLYPDFK